MHIYMCGQATGLKSEFPITEKPAPKEPPLPFFRDVLSPKCQKVTNRNIGMSSTVSKMVSMISSPLRSFRFDSLNHRGIKNSRPLPARAERMCCTSLISTLAVGRVQG